MVCELGGRRKTPLHSLPVMPPVVRAALWMVGTLLAFAFMALAGRELSGEINALQILFFRSIIGLPIVIALILWYDRGLFRTRHIGTHVARNAAHFPGQFFWFLAIATIPLAEAFALEFTQPLWGTIFAVLLLGERFTRHRAIALVLGIVGALVILRPGLVEIRPGALAMLTSALAYGFAHTLTKRLADRDPALTILFYMMAIQLAIGAVPALVSWVTPSPGLWPWVAIVGLTALAAQYCLTRALALADLTVVLPMDFLRLPLIAVFGWFLYGEAVGWPVFAGAALIIAGILTSVNAERRR